MDLQSLPLHTHEVELVLRGGKSTLRTKMSRQHDNCHLGRRSMQVTRYIAHVLEALKCQLQLHTYNLSWARHKFF